MSDVYETVTDFLSKKKSSHGFKMNLNGDQELLVIGV